MTAGEAEVAPTMLRVHFRDLLTGATRVDASFPYYDDGGSIYYFSEGNFGCDCNRSAYLYPDVDGPDIDCNRGANRIVVDTLDLESGLIICDDFKTLNPDNWDWEAGVAIDYETSEREREARERHEAFEEWTKGLVNLIGHGEMSVKDRWQAMEQAFNAGAAWQKQQTPGYADGT